VSLNQFTQRSWQVVRIAEVNAPWQLAFLQVGAQMRKRYVVSFAQSPERNVKVRVGFGAATERPSGYP
jgi:hypothetical protein